MEFIFPWNKLKKSLNNIKKEYLYIDLYCILGFSKKVENLAMIRKRNPGKNPDLEKVPDSGKDYSLVLHDDDIHDFTYVIDSLIDICDHDLVQAEQCTYIVHYRGECDVKTGKYEQLKAMYNNLIEKGLTVSIN